MSSEEDKFRSNEPNPQNQPEEIDMSALMAGIKRVAPNGAQKSSAKRAPETNRVTAQPAAQSTAKAPASKQAGRPSQNRPSAENKKRAAAMARRKKVERLMILTIVLVVLLIGTGIFLAVSKLVKNKEKDTTASSSTTSSPTTAVSSELSLEESSTTTTETSETTAPPTPTPTPFPAGGPNLTGYCVVIDPGHQEVANTSQESMSSSMGGSKDKSKEGYAGVVSGMNESEINLKVACLLADYLRSLGCEVYLTRETNDVDISNQERAEFAVSKDPDAFIRLYCNAANDSKTSGCEVIVPARGKYSSEVKTWGDNLGKSIVSFTNGAFNGCKSSGNYSGLNWADSIPSFMIRMGYLSNSDDEANLLDEAYQMKICQGIAQFVATMPQH